MHADPEEAADGWGCWLVVMLMLLLTSCFVAWLARVAGLCLGRM